MAKLSQQDWEHDLEKGFTFLAQYNWIHNFPLTHIFKDEVLQKFPQEWLSPLQDLTLHEINNLPFLETSSLEKYPNWPPSLHRFLSAAASLSMERTQVNSVVPAVVDQGMARGMTPKKLHEVSWMAALVHDIVCTARCQLVVDIGSGLGYLDHVLHQVYGHKVLGLEISESHSSAAEIRAVKQGITCNGIRSLKLDIRNDMECFKQLEAIISDLSLSCQCSHSVKGSIIYSDNPPSSSAKVEQTGHPRVCLIGLHCCGDLSTSVLSLFHHVTSIKALCCVCCCYHKMAFSDGLFSKFPMSYAGHKCLEKVQSIYPSWYISSFTMRLGAQETRMRWRTQSLCDHDDHQRHVAYRGLLQMTDSADSTCLRQRIRKADFSSFGAFLDSYLSSCYQEKTAPSHQIKSLYEQHQHEFDLIEILTCLQVIVQPVVESLVYKDRLQWLQEQGHSKVKVVSLFDEEVSPRNLALCAIK